MRLGILFLLVALCVCPAAPQNAVFPLESVGIEGSSIPQPVILEIAGLRLGSPVDKAGIERACKALQESGLFASISYRYAPGPKKGYVVTLLLADQDALAEASIDIPGADESEAWEWLAAKFRRFDHRAPQADAGQKYLAAQLEQHLDSRLRAQRLTARLETDLKTRKMIVSFQPEILPRLHAVTFSRNQAVGSLELASVLDRIVLNEEYTDRRFAAAVELNLRPIYEQHGFYRVALAPGSPQLTGSDVSVNVAITEGPPYQLGNVDLVGEGLPVAAMLSAAGFPKGKLANWKQIQQGIWEMEKVVKRKGFLETAASPERIYDDARRLLNLRIAVSKGPLYHFGEVRFTGLSAPLQQRARELWRPKPGDPYDYAYPGEFFQAFSRVVDFRNIRKYDAVAKPAAGDHVMDINVVFEPR